MNCLICAVSAQKPITRPEEQHELVKRGVEHIVEEQAMSGGGQLGGPSGHADECMNGSSRTLI
jgi:hypothetical protein